MKRQGCRFWRINRQTLVLTNNLDPFWYHLWRLCFRNMLLRGQICNPQKNYQYICCFFAWYLKQNGSHFYDPEKTTNHLQPWIKTIITNTTPWPLHRNQETHVSQNHWNHHMPTNRPRKRDNRGLVNHVLLAETTWLVTMTRDPEFMVYMKSLFFWYNALIYYYDISFLQYIKLFFSHKNPTVHSYLMSFISFFEPTKYKYSFNIIIICKQSTLESPKKSYETRGMTFFPTLGGNLWEFSRGVFPTRCSCWVTQGGI